MPDLLETVDGDLEEEKTKKQMSSSKYLMLDRSLWAQGDHLKVTPGPGSQSSGKSTVW